MHKNSTDRNKTCYGVYSLQVE